jgi:hypothetical protein
MMSENLAKFGKSRLTTPARPVTNVPSTPRTIDYEQMEEVPDTHDEDKPVEEEEEEEQ